MPKNPCRLCRNIRWIALSVMCGGGAGLAVHGLGGSANQSMTATFLGAIAPLMWRARQERRQGRRD